MRTPPPNLESGLDLLWSIEYCRICGVPGGNLDLKFLCTPDLSFGQEIHHENKSGKQARQEGPCGEELSCPAGTISDQLMVNPRYLSGLNQDQKK